jgi:Uma2 family endonuclease
MVVFGRPKGDRGSYRQWEEENIAPQVVFEILSPGNRMGEMERKLRFYEQYGVEEYYIYDPDQIDLTGWIRQGGRLEAIEDIEDWIRNED